MTPAMPPSFGGSDLPSPSELDEVLDPEPVEDAAGSASASELKHPMDDKLLVELGDGEPPKDEVLKQQAISPEHLRTHFPKKSLLSFVPYSKRYRHEGFTCQRWQSR